MDINDVVVLKIDLPAENLVKGMRGVIVSVFNDPELAYEVEFCDDKGVTIAEVALKENLLGVPGTQYLTRRINP